MSQKLQAVRGMNDLLPDASAAWERFEATITRIFRQYGYRSMRTPIVEPTALFARAIGAVTDIVEKEMYNFQDGDESLTLRPEGTAGLVRAAIEHNLTYNAPQRVWTVGPMFRHERPQKGRYRQFHQFDAECFGYAGPDVDAELIIMLQRIWRELGVAAHVKLEINSIGDAAERKAHREKLVAYFEQHQDVLDEDSKRRLHTNPLRILDSKNPALQAINDAAPKLIDMLGEDTRAHFEALKAALTEAGIAFTINPRLVRGMDYYNRTVFEFVTDKLGAQATITGGGRYDGLFEQLGGKPTPAIGFGMGVERVLLLMETLGLAHADAVDVYVVHVPGGATSEAETTARATQLGEWLRDDGFAVIVNAGGGKFPAQFKRADASRAMLAAVLGEGEIAGGTVTLKLLREGPNSEAQAHAVGEQWSVPLADFRAAVAATIGVSRI